MTAFIEVYMYLTAHQKLLAQKLKLGVDSSIYYGIM